MTPNHHEYTIPLSPNSEQVRALDTLSALTHRIKCAALQQARLGMTTSLAALLGGPNHLERGDEAEIRALQVLPSMAEVPFGLIQQAVTGRRARIRRGDLAAPARPTPVSGNDLIMPAEPDGLTLAGVPGVIEASIDRLPPWAAQVWEHAAGGPKPTLDPRLVTASVTRWAYIERGSYAGTSGWLIDIALDWDAYPTWQLMRDGDGWGDEPWRREVRHLMV
ncbi:hypothetical protein QR90_08615 [Deinococcus radiopugnans]|uniref:Uncharacterized protein n=1 Tax=Deinococcus radiopugnans TaxID=57497 RepID=A0A0A7KGC0_9DEIO|nr:hypothetical protein [Deinococcus radiopugnans]AIZ45150.1 hypothetical protein QR90_08615 [Deinococcus radiopugnans]